MPSKSDNSKRLWPVISIRPVLSIPAIVRMLSLLPHPVGPASQMFSDVDRRRRQSKDHAGKTKAGFCEGVSWQGASKYGSKIPVFGFPKSCPKSMDVNVREVVIFFTSFGYVFLLAISYASKEDCCLHKA